jgi:hypothetical protein
MFNATVSSPEDRMHEHVFADETKAGGLVLVAAVVQPARLAELRTQVSSLRMKGQQRLHFTRESNARRSMIVKSLARMGLQARLYDATGFRDAKDGRDAAIAQLTEDALAMGAARMVLERDESVERNDRLVIRSMLMKVSPKSPLRYEHLSASQECLLTVPDAIAWCWARDKNWRKCVEPLITDIIRL